MSQPLKVEPDLEFIRRVQSLGGDSLKKCYQCATCSVVCELSPEENPFPRKEMLWSQWGLKDNLMADPDVWLCYQCNDCTVNCPRGAKPGDVLNAVRAAVIERYSFPKFMGKALATRAALPFLVLVAAAFIFLIVFFSGGDGPWGLSAPTPEKGSYYTNFLYPTYVDILFVSGVLFVVFSLWLSLSKFWKDMKNGYGVKEGGPTFVSCAIEAVKDIGFHRNFNSCGANKVRTLSHLLLFWGFVGAFITTGFAFLFMYGPLIIPSMPDFGPPMSFWNPVKILGNLSLFAMLAGLLIMIIRRVQDKDNQVGTGGFTNTFFLGVIFTVVLSGGLTQFARMGGLTSVAYALYFIHLTGVFCLLLYMPYSKLAHMFYRGLAIVFAKSIGRSRKEAVN